MPYFTKPKKGKDKKYRWNFKSDNHETLVASEPYDTLQSAYQGQKDLIKNALIFASGFIEKSSASVLKKM